MKSTAVARDVSTRYATPLLKTRRGVRQDGWARGGLHEPTEGYEEYRRAHQLNEAAPQKNRDFNLHDGEPAANRDVGSSAGGGVGHQFGQIPVHHNSSTDAQSSATSSARREPLTEEPDRGPQAVTHLPNLLKTGLEHLSRMDLSDVRVHYNSPNPTQLNALAYAQGRDIYLKSGQDRHLPHEGWHVVQQLQGRVNPLTPKNGVLINDDARLEAEADIMGRRASQATRTGQLLSAESQRGTATPERRVRCMLPRTENGQPSAHRGYLGTPQLLGVEEAALAVDIGEKILSSAGGGSDLDISADESDRMFISEAGKSSGMGNAPIERKAEQFEFLAESVPFREDLIRVKVIMDYEVGRLGTGPISFALVEAHDSGAGWGGRFDFNLTPRESSLFGEFTLTVNFDVSGWIGSFSGSFSYLVGPYGRNVYLVRSAGDVNGFSDMNQKHFRAQSA